MQVGIHGIVSRYRADRWLRGIYRPASLACSCSRIFL